MPALSPWPLWSQLKDYTADGRPDENAFNNCGPESVAECLKYLTGIELPADYIKDVMYGEAHMGYTDVEHIVQFLQDKCQVPCETYQGDASTLLQPIVRQAINAKTPLIVLYFWELSDPASGHFCPVVGYDELGCTRANVWNGQLEYWDWNTFEEWQKLGICIVLKRRRAADLPPAPTPQPVMGMAPAVRGGSQDPLVQRMQSLLAEAQPYIRRLHKEVEAVR